MTAMQRAPKPKADTKNTPVVPPMYRPRPAPTTLAMRQGKSRAEGVPRSQAPAATKLPPSITTQITTGKPQQQNQIAPTMALQTSIGERLSKRVAALGNCSRTEAEQYIEGGLVKVDGIRIETIGHRVEAHQNIEIHPKASRDYIATVLAEVTLLLHKPVGFDCGEGTNPALYLLTKNTQAKGTSLGYAQSQIQFIERHFANLRPTTPLPKEASGLIVFTQDFRIARKLNDDADRVEQECLVHVQLRRGKGIADLHVAVERLCHGLTFNGVPLPPMRVSVSQHTEQGAIALRFAFKGARPGQIPEMCERVGLQLMAIQRIRIGRIPLGDLPLGQWQYLPAFKTF